MNASMSLQHSSNHPHPMNIATDKGTDRELELRTHIRGLLLQYALTHLTTNYVTWTQESVADVSIHSTNCRMMLTYLMYSFCPNVYLLSR